MVECLLEGGCVLGLIGGVVAEVAGGGGVADGDGLPGERGLPLSGGHVCVSVRPVFSQEPAQPPQWPRVDHIFRSEPSALCRAESVA